MSSDIRLIVHKTESSLLLCFVDHHDKAYDWAERRRLDIHPTTGAAQWVEIRETVKEIVVPRYVQSELVLAPTPKPALKPLFADTSDDDLLGYGVPAEWLADVKQATKDTLLVLADHLPAEAAEALLELATGGKPGVPVQPKATANPFDHPDAQRRFRPMWRSCNAPSISLGRSGLFSCTPSNGNGWSGTTRGRRASAAQRAPARPSSPCTGPLIWRAPIPMPACC